MVDRGRTMGNKYFSYLMVLMLVVSGFGIISSSTAKNNGNIITGIRTMDNDNSFTAATEMDNYTLYSNSVNTGDDPYDYYKIKLNIFTQLIFLFPFIHTLKQILY